MREIPLSVSILKKVSHRDGTKFRKFREINRQPAPENHRSDFYNRLLGFLLLVLGFPNTPLPYKSPGSPARNSSWFTEPLDEAPFTSPHILFC
jgi:hypothetical protein